MILYLEKSQTMGDHLVRIMFMRSSSCVFGRMFVPEWSINMYPLVNGYNGPVISS